MTQETNTKAVQDAISELKVLALDEDYRADSFTLQPLKLAIQAAEPVATGGTETVKRYEPFPEGTVPTNENGDSWPVEYVSATDYDALLRENEALKAKLDHRFDQVSDLATRSELQERELEYLRAETARLQSPSGEGQTRQFANPCKELCQYLMLDDEIQKLRSALIGVIAGREKMLEVFEWLLGESGDFPTRPPYAGAYWWRNDLRQRLDSLLSKGEGMEK